MKLEELLKLCQSEDSAVCLNSNQKLRYHAAMVLPDLVCAARKHLEMGHSSSRYSLAAALKAAEKVE